MVHVNNLTFYTPFLVKKKFWLGIFSTDGINWQNIDGDIIPQEMLAWYPGRLSSNATKTHVGMQNNWNKGVKDFLVDIDPSWESFSALCDMLAKKRHLTKNRSLKLGSRIDN